MTHYYLSSPRVTGMLTLWHNGRVDPKWTAPYWIAFFGPYDVRDRLEQLLRKRGWVLREMPAANIHSGDGHV